MRDTLASLFLVVVTAARDGEQTRGEKKNKQTSIAHLLSSLVASSTISLLGDFLRSRMAVVKSFLGAPAAPAAPPSTEGFFLSLREGWLKGEARQRERKKGREKRESIDRLAKKKARLDRGEKESRGKREHRNMSAFASAFVASLSLSSACCMAERRDPRVPRRGEGGRRDRDRSERRDDESPPAPLSRNDGSPPLSSASKKRGRAPRPFASPSQPPRQARR